MDWSVSIYRSVAGFCEHGNDPPRYKIKFYGSLSYLGKQRSPKNSVHAVNYALYTTFTRITTLWLQ
jgi:hypothetical protein